MKLTITDNTGLAAFVLEIDDEMLDKKHGRGELKAWQSPVHFKHDGKRHVLELDGRRFDATKLLLQIAQAVKNNKLR